MRDKLLRLVDQPVSIRTVSDTAVSTSIRGLVFDVGAETVDILIDRAILQTVRISAIVDLTPGAPGEDAPTHEAYPKAKRLLYDAERASITSRQIVPHREAKSDNPELNETASRRMASSEFHRHGERRARLARFIS